MIKLYKNRSPNFKKISLLFISQILLGTLPIALFAIYVFYIQRLERFEEYNIFIGVVFISIMSLALIGYSVAAKKYNILVSGYRGERILVKVAKKLNGDYTVFTNLPIRYKKNRSEIDLLLLGESGVLIIEVKNHSGVIIGSDNAQTWIHRKYYRKGRTSETEMENPFNQIKRQREILKSILRANGLDIWVDSILFFSGNPSLRLRADGGIAVASSEEELIEIISGYQSKIPPTKQECDNIIKILKI
ncbi:MAG: NERD domain-containing protein [Oscillospiraceae bacterium]|nr:NERD domain-containing protein [Oscillospiraceae bacterium]